MGHKRKKHYGQKNREIATPSCGTVRNDKQERIATSHAAPRNDRRGGGAPEFEVRILISKQPGEKGFEGSIVAKDADILVDALAVMIQEAAVTIGISPDRVYAVVATRLFKETSSVSPDGADTFPKGEGTEGMEG